MVAVKMGKKGKNNGIYSNYVDSLQNRGSLFDKKIWSTVKEISNKSKQNPLG